MAGMKLYTSNRLEVLAEKLAEVLSRPLASVLQREIILVQSRGMERWVSMELARRHGICANCWFPFPNHFVAYLFRQVLADVPEDERFDPSVMTWKVMKILPAHLPRKAFETLRNYLAEGAAELKLFQLAQKIAGLFDQYLLFRPEMILDWEAGRGNDWQAVLWRELAKGEEGKNPAALQKAFLEALRRPSAGLPELPERISVFGISALPPFHLHILGEIARFIEVNLFLMNPCREYWGDLLTRREMHEVRERGRRRSARREDLHLGKGNSLLASMGMLGRDFFDLLSAWEAEEQELFCDPARAGEGTLLASIQSDILNLRERGLAEGGKKTLREEDDSIQVHSCHSPMREVEVLQDRLLALWEADPSLLPKDVLVMTPDIAAYSPFIQAVFSVGRDDSRYIPFSIADRGIRQESRVTEAFLALLELQGSRFGVSQVMTLLERPPVREKFLLAEDDLDLIRGWVKETRIRWGVDAESRKALGLPEFSENTWRAGLERMLLGYALPGRDGQIFQGILPYGGIEGSDAAVLGRFTEFAERLFALGKALGEPRSLKEWAEFLTGVVEEFFIPGDDTEEDLLFLRRMLRNLGEKEELSGFCERIGLGVVQSQLRSTLECETLGHGFLTGGITFCAMLPMRSIPFRVISLLGMNDDAYPRQTKPLGFDLLAKKPRPGDRSRRNDDRYLFLEAVLSAREQLHISYVGQSIEDNSIRPPSVLVSELLDYLEEGFEITGEKILDHVVLRHRLQAFSPDYFQKKGRLFSYSGENLEAARRARQPDKEAKPFISRGLPEPPQEWKTLDLLQLLRFLRHPSRFLLTQRLGIHLEEEDAVFDEVEPFEVKGLERYQLEQDLADKACAKGGLGDAFRSVKASGQLPHGVPGECFYRQTCRGIEAFIQRLAPYREEAVLQPLDVDLRLGEFRLLGRVENVYSHGLLHFRYADVTPQDRLRIWLNMLILNVAGNKPLPGILVSKDVGCKYPPPGESKEHLQNLLKAYWQGLQRPIHFFPRSSWAYVQASAKGKGPGEALALARNKWQGNDFNNEGEMKDPYLQVCFAHEDPLDEEFVAWSEMIFGPLAQCEERIKKG